MTLLKIEELVNIGLSKKWGMLKVYNCIDLSVHPCTALSSDTFCIGKYYTFHCTGKKLYLVYMVLSLEGSGYIGLSSFLQTWFKMSLFASWPPKQNQKSSWNNLELLLYMTLLSFLLCSNILTQIMYNCIRIYSIFVTKADTKLVFIELLLNFIDIMMARYHIKSYYIHLKLIQYTAT